MAIWWERLLVGNVACIWPTLIIIVPNELGCRRNYELQGDGNGLLWAWRPLLVAVHCGCTVVVNLVEGVARRNKSTTNCHGWLA